MTRSAAGAAAKSPIKISVGYVRTRPRGSSRSGDHGTPWSTVVAQPRHHACSSSVGYRGLLDLVGRHGRGSRPTRRWAPTCGRGSGSTAARCCSTGSSSTPTARSRR
ncbi:MAG: hypothetical protein MZV64_13475 [Ignavibacteriales bacterium]|nr:hypothetical protein [Ignavibacteriales bacterium]